ncbi:hypothetical protein KGQ34_01315 [Patescibacteria group bacterium]|nr:hypothetical protein [Patescibacteria group bacterium]
MPKSSKSKDPLIWAIGEYPIGIVSGSIAGKLKISRVRLWKLCYVINVFPAFGIAG